MATLIDELEQCFNAIPRDGSNVVEQDANDDFATVMEKASSAAKADDESDDNGYEVASKTDATPFDEKVVEVAAAVLKASATPALAFTPIEAAPEPTPEPKAEVKPTPTPVPSPAPVAEQAPVAAPVPVVKAPVIAPVAPAVTPLLAMADNLFDELPQEPIVQKSEAKKTKKAEVQAEKPAVQIPVAAIEDLLVTATEAAPLKPGQPSGIVVAAKTDLPPVVDPVVTEPPSEAPRRGGQVSVTTAGPATDPDTSNATAQHIVWQLTATFPQFEEFYNFKRSVLPFMLKGGRLPLDRFENELTGARADVECSYDLRSMYEQMKLIQAQRVRITEIATQLNSQYFIWKRFMEILRADAARMEGLKGGQVEAAALRHLWDFEIYFEKVRSLTESAEHVLKTLEAGWNTLNRGVTISLEAHGHERGLTRYEASPTPQAPAVRVPAPDLGNFDPLDVGPSTMQKHPGKPSQSMLLQKGGGDQWGDDL